MAVFNFKKLAHKHAIWKNSTLHFHSVVLIYFRPVRKVLSKGINALESTSTAHVVVSTTIQGWWNTIVPCDTILLLDPCLKKDHEKVLWPISKSATSFLSCGYNLYQHEPQSNKNHVKRWKKPKRTCSRKKQRKRKSDFGFFRFSVLISPFSMCHPPLSTITSLPGKWVCDNK